MGMFDWFDWFEFDVEYIDTFTCSKCGALMNGLQTKNFECLGDRIRLGHDEGLEARSPLTEDDSPRQHWRVIRDTCYARVYSSCHVCSVWNEWRLHVREGKVVEIVRRHEAD